jgi:hypothetical protein
MTTRRASFQLAMPAFKPAYVLQALPPANPGEAPAPRPRTL